jgi:membrane-associated phospholipid phosphatase
VRFRPRPAELVLLLFMSYCLVRAGAGGILAFDRHAVPRGDIFIVLLFVLSLRLGLEYRNLPWPPSLSRARRRHLFSLLAFLLLGIVPAVFVFVALPRYLPGVSARDGGALMQSVLFAYACLRVGLAFLVPGALLWLASGLYLKRHGGFTLGGFLAESGPAALDVLRDWIPPLALIYCYLALGPVISQRLFPDRDLALAHLDELLFFGRNPSQLCEKLISPALSEWLSGCYVFYGPLFPLVLGALYAKRERAPFRETAFALSLVLSVGYLGYALVPAVGPLFTEKFERPLDLYYTGWIKDRLMDRVRLPRDCFPSLHTAASLTLLWGARRVPSLAWGLLPIVLSIPFACVYLRYHYVTDILAGLALFGAVAAWSSRSPSLQARFRS